MKVKIGIFSLTFLFLLERVYAQGPDIERDPFASVLPQRAVITGPALVEQEPAPPAITVEGVLWGTNYPQAIIDGEVYRVGDKLKNISAQIIKIKENTVFVSYQDRIFEMRPIKIKEEKR